MHETTALTRRINWNEQGLVPAIAQDWRSGEVLMLAWMNEQALALTIEEGRAHGAGVVVKFAGYDDRDQAATLIQSDIAIRRTQLPPAAPGEYYWADLAGLQVVTLEGVELGTVDRIFATGANDVLIVKGERERLLPFVKGQVIVEVDLKLGRLRVDWDPDF